MSKQEEEIPFEALTGEYTFDPALEAEGGPSEVDQYYHEEPTFWENLCNRYGKRALRALGVVVGIGALMGLVDGLDGKLDGRFDIFSNLNKSAEAAGLEPLKDTPRFSPTPAPTATPERCHDSDRGVNVWEKGTMSISGEGARDDFCAPGLNNVLIEGVCCEDDPNYVNNPPPNCPESGSWYDIPCRDYNAICQDGACVSPDSTPLPTATPAPGQKIYLPFVGKNQS